MKRFFRLRILAKLNLLKYFNLQTILQVENRKFIIPIYNSIGLSLIYYEKDWMSDLLNELSQRNNGVFIDVGTNIGQTLIAYQLNNINGEYIGFEPNINCSNYISHVIFKNNFNNARVFNVGLSNINKLDQLILNNASDVDPAASMITELRPGKEIYKQINFISIKLDDFVLSSKIQKIDIIKIDVEGAEYEVIMGATDTIKKYRPVILCEMLNADSAGTIVFVQNRTKEIVKLMQELNYDIYRTIKFKNRFKKLEKIDFITIGLYSEEDNDLCDYAFVPGK